MPTQTHTSPFPAGTIIKFKEQGEWSYYKITNDFTTWHQTVCYETLPKGTQIYSVVWKKGNIEKRGLSVKKTDATKTIAQWEAEGKKRYDEHIAAQISARAQYDQLVEKLDNADLNTPEELTSFLGDLFKLGK